jgi:hypothetical protein
VLLPGGATQSFEPEQHAGDENKIMANTLLPLEERSLTPDQVELLDKRRRRGQLFLVICFQCLIVSALLSLWSGQDLTLSPGWIHPIAYWNAITLTLAVVFGLVGIRLRRGSNEFISY